MHKNYAAAELQKAREQRELFEGAESLQYMEERWRDFLHRLDRVWNKIGGQYHADPRFTGWQGKYIQARKDDPLLAYLRQARNADEHGVEQLAHQDPGGVTGFSVGGGSGEWVYVDHLIINEGSVQYKGSAPLNVHAVSPHLRLVQITHRGVLFPPPTSHLGMPVNPLNMVALMDLALAYYSAVVADAEKFFAA